MVWEDGSVRMCCSSSGIFWRRRRDSALGGWGAWWGPAGGGGLHSGSPLVHEEVQREGQSPACSVPDARLCGGVNKHRAAASGGAGAMAGIQTLYLFLALCAGNSESWFWLSAQDGGTTETPTEALTTNASTTPVTATNAAKEEEDDNLSGIGEIPDVASGILDVASEIPQLVEAWNASRWNTDGAGGKAEPNSTGNATTPRGEGEREGSGSGWGPAADAGSGGESVLCSPGATAAAPDGVGEDAPLPACLPAPSDWPICSARRPQTLTLPNIFNHTSVEEVGAVLREWAWLVERGCHPSAEWFLCLLLAPGCPRRAPLPCRSFCQTLRDSCWAWLDHGRLPVACQHLPDVAPPTCVSVSNWKGNLSACFSPFRLVLHTGPPPPPVCWLTGSNMQKPPAVPRLRPEDAAAPVGGACPPSPPALKPCLITAE